MLSFLFSAGAAPGRHHGADRAHGGAQLIRGHAQLGAPVADLVVLVDVDAAPVGRAAVHGVVGHVSSSWCGAANLRCRRPIAMACAINIPPTILEGSYD